MTQRGTGREGKALDPRGFCAGSYPWPLIGELADGEDVTAVYLVLESRRAETRNNKPYLKLVLGDSTGTIDAMVWEDADRWEPFCAVEAVVGVRGRVGSFQDRLQLRVTSVEALTASPEDMARLLPASRRPRATMERELATLIASVEDSGLRALLERCLGSDTESGRAFRAHPAAKRNHHAYLSGLLEHSLSVAGACDRLALHYRESGVELDRDLLITGALLHDIGKLRELKGFPGVVYTTEGQLLGHIVIGIQMVSREAEALGEIDPDRLLHLLHLIASHQGRPEWDSPRVPQMLEALVLHYADDLDAKVNQAGALLDGVAAGEWSQYDRSFARSFLRPEVPARMDAPPASLPRTGERSEAGDDPPAVDDDEEARADPAAGAPPVSDPRPATREKQTDDERSSDDGPTGPVMDLFR